ncbi:hypothetical protein SteCoe_33632 [Stentor coeruleus]|uniref:Uncharacterized protein n=1 Tax=Stentor coeruleus TaxID=5963 RepID=A0A1R2AWA6_9CILI|nr:hypothetical protein SteCoe_33632 [Stentor coeruleus]
MNHSCFSENCKNHANKILHCQKIKLICCSYHEKEHKDYCGQTSHKDKNLYQKMPSSTLENTIIFLQQQISIIKDKRENFLTKILTYIEQLNKLSQQIVRQLDITEKLCLWMLKCVIKAQVFPTFLWPGKSSPLNDKYIINELFYHVKSYPNSTLNLSFDIFQTIQDSNIFLPNSDNLEDFLYEDYLYIVTDQTQGILKFDPDKMIYKNLFNKEGSIKGLIKGSNYSICQLPQRKLFINGGNNSNQRLKSTYIYDIRNQELQKLFDIPKARHNISATYYNDRVYMFGGNLNQNYFTEKIFSGNTCDCADCFDLINRNWIGCEKMPQKASFVNVAVLKNQFVLVGEDNFAFIYFPLNDCYKKISNEIITGQKTQTFANGNKVFILGKYLYISTGVEEHWNKHDVSLGYTKNCCKPLIKGDYVFFFDLLWSIYRFNCRDYTLDEVGKADVRNLYFF